MQNGCMVILQSNEMLSPKANLGIPPVAECETSNQLRVRSTFEVELILEDPIIGRDYLAGYLNDRTYFYLIKKQAVARLLEIPASFSELPWSRASAGEQIAMQQLPALATIRILGGQPEQLWLKRVDRGFLVSTTSFEFAIATSAIQEIILPTGTSDRSIG